MNRAYFIVSRELMLDLLRGGAQVSLVEGAVRVLTTDLPADIRILHMEWDFATDGVRVIVESSTFRPTAPGEQLYAINPKLHHTMLRAMIQTDGKRSI